MRNIFISAKVVLLVAFFLPCRAQVLDSLVSLQKDTTLVTNRDAIYNRPFVLSAQLGRTSTALGGYIEGNTNYFVTDGVGDGFSMELRRCNLFVYSTVASRIRFLSELEFEHGAGEINLEMALLDIEIHPALVFRSGILLPPIGYFNQNHDSPKWDFIDRPLVSTTIIPSTLSEVGFGFHGKLPLPGANVLTYELYAVNGLSDGIIANAGNRTSLQEGKSAEMFAEDLNGVPMYTGRAAARNRNIGEVGLSYYGGVYNTFRIDGLDIASKHRLDLVAFDLNLRLAGVQLNGEIAKAKVDVPPTYSQQFGTRQWGLHADLIWPVLRGSLLHWQNTIFNICLRYERVDYNEGMFSEGPEIGDEITTLVGGLSLRIESNTVLKANYRYLWSQDILNNPYVRTAGFQFGLASYF